MIDEKIRQLFSKLYEPQHSVDEAQWEQMKSLLDADDRKQGRTVFFWTWWLPLILSLFFINGSQSSSTRDKSLTSIADTTGTSAFISNKPNERVGKTTFSNQPTANFSIPINNEKHFVSPDETTSNRHGSVGNTTIWLSNLKKDFVVMDRQIQLPENQQINIVRLPLIPVDTLEGTTLSLNNEHIPSGKRTFIPVNAPTGGKMHFEAGGLFAYGAPNLYTGVRLSVLIPVYRKWSISSAVETGIHRADLPGLSSLEKGYGFGYLNFSQSFTKTQIGTSSFWLGINKRISPRFTLGAQLGYEFEIYHKGILEKSLESNFDQSTIETYELWNYSQNSFSRWTNRIYLSYRLNNNFSLSAGGMAPNLIKTTEAGKQWPLGVLQINYRLR